MLTVLVIISYLSSTGIETGILNVKLKILNDCFCLSRESLSKQYNCFCNLNLENRIQVYRKAK